MSKTSNKFVFTSESVSPGHPDKVCDQISDALLDHVLSSEPFARCAFESMVTKDNIIIAGEVRVKDQSIVRHDNLERVIKNLIKNIGYEQEGFSWKNTPIKFIFHTQSSDIAMGVDENTNLNKKQGAGDQGIMFGYACNETESYMPSAIYYAHKILSTIWALKPTNNDLQKLGPDAKSQVSLVYENGKITSTDSVTLSIQHPEEMSVSDVKKIVIPIIKDIMPNKTLPTEDRIFINPTGRFVIGGPVSDTGLTGRKIIVDTYGGSAPHGGGAFSGKDPTKVDRSAAYMARYIAKNIVASGICSECTIQLSYVIGVSEPISVFIKTSNDCSVSLDKLEEFIRKQIPLDPSGIRSYLNLNRPIYLKTSTFGHFGREYCKEDGCFSWEKLDIVEKIKSSLLVRGS